MFDEPDVSFFFYFRFVNHTGEVTFTCRFIHSLPLLMSAVQVFYHDRMAAVAHLVGSDQLPLPEQVYKWYRSLKLKDLGVKL